MGMDKGLLTNLSAGALVIAGLAAPEPVAPYFLSAGLFALSGALTNSLAIHMLFERVPGLYGSGVIALHFEEFKSSIRELIMQQFFSSHNLERFFDAQTVMHSGMDSLLPELVEELDMDKAFDAMTEAIMSSSMGSMLGFVGGVKALEGLRAPFAERMKSHLLGFVESDRFQQAFADKLGEVTHSDAVLARIEALIDNRLQELTPQQIKLIVQQMMRSHLGWLVVWGGVVGGVLGLMVALLTALV
jgi:uncharacterized membrane protein YheB (UPF0754 family)